MKSFLLLAVCRITLKLYEVSMLQSFKHFQFKITIINKVIANKSLALLIKWNFQKIILLMCRKLELNIL